eukprot:4182833-Alexandrium_andersonii.AAC.1
MAHLALPTSAPALGTIASQPACGFVVRGSPFLGDPHRPHTMPHSSPYSGQPSSPYNAPLLLHTM